MVNRLGTHWRRIAPPLPAVAVVLFLAGCSTLSGGGSTTSAPSTVIPHREITGRDEVPPPPHQHGEASRSPARRPEQSDRTETAALEYVGSPYRWGGSTPAGFDCSGFVRYVYAKSGIALPRTASAQYRVGAPVRRGSLQPGDLVFFDRRRHNGIYIGQGWFVHASSGERRVSISHLDDDWFRQRFNGGRRVQVLAPPRDDVTSERVATLRETPVD